MERSQTEGTPTFTFSRELSNALVWGDWMTHGLNVTSEKTVVGKRARAHKNGQLE